MAPFPTKRKQPRRQTDADPYSTARDSLSPASENTAINEGLPLPLRFGRQSRGTRPGQSSDMSVSWTTCGYPMFYNHRLSTQNPLKNPNILGDSTLGYVVGKTMGRFGARMLNYRELRLRDLINEYAP